MRNRIKNVKNNVCVFFLKRLLSEARIKKPKKLLDKVEMCIHVWKDELFIIGIKISSVNNNVVHQDC